MIKTKWYYPCCQEDLTQGQFDDSVKYDMELFDTKAEAKLDIIAMWIRSIDLNGVDRVIKNVKETLEK